MAMFRRCFTNLSEDKIVTLYQSIVRPALEFSSTAWSPYTKKDIETLEKVQTRCLRLCSNETKTKIESLQERRQETDLIDTYRYLHDIYRNSSEKFLSAPNKDLRGHTKKLYQRRTRTKLAGHFFSNRVVQPWNSLPKDIVSAPTVATFKRKLRALPIGQEG